MPLFTGSKSLISLPQYKILSYIYQRVVQFSKLQKKTEDSLENVWQMFHNIDISAWKD